MAFPRQVSLEISAFGFDHEGLFGGSHETRSELPQNHIHNYRLFDRNKVSLPNFIMPWGGECRFELYTNIEVLEDTETLRVSGNALLFEGTSEDTQDLAGRIDFSEDIPSTVDLVPHRVEIKRRVDNTAEGDDYADFTITVRNTGAVAR